MIDGVDIAMALGEWAGRRGPGTLMLANRSGQLAWNEFIGARLQEFDYGDGDLALKWHVAGKDSLVVIDPRIRFGAPSVEGVSTTIIKDRAAGGESIRSIADDFDMDQSFVIDALRFESLNGSEWRH